MVSTEGGMSLQERLEKLGEVEKELYKSLQTAYNYMAELSKDRVPQAKQLEPLKAKFNECVKKVELELHSEIDRMSQVSVGASHEGSTYIPKQREDMAEERVRIVENNVVQQVFSVNTALPPNS